VASPVNLAPAGAQGRFNPEAELDSARAARWAGTIFALSSASTYSLEEVRDASDGTLFFQRYVLKDRGLTADLVKRAENAGYAAIIVTVDEPATRSGQPDGVSNALRESRQPKRLKSHTPASPFGNLPVVIGGQPTRAVRWGGAAGRNSRHSRRRSSLAALWAR
jgi:FMN-dependent dehydrogenase